ncbi:MAG TPA: hypothetical protein VIC06_08615 [Solirubrobacteraceae bacterium]|jgi:hypothetical protein
MIKAKLVAVFSVMVAVLAVSAAPAFAEFQSNTGVGHGEGNSGAVVLEGGGATLECTSAEGEWEILSGGVEATKGTSMQIKSKKFNGCKAKSSIINGAAATVKACTFELKQAAGSTKAVGSTVTECTVEVKVLGTCTIKVPGGQTGLEKNTLSNSGSNLLTVAEDTGITTKPSGFCLGIKETKEAKQKATITGIGLKEV